MTTVPNLEELQASLNAVGTTDEALSKLIDSFIKTEYPQTQTDIDRIEVSLLTSIHVQGDIFGSVVHNKIAEHFEKLRVSRNRLGRREAQDMARMVKEQQEHRSLRSRIFGAFGR